MILKRLIKLALLRRQGVFSDHQSSVAYPSKMSSASGDRKPSEVRVVRSDIGSVVYGEGCRFWDCSVSGNVVLGRFVSISGPSTRISSRLHGVSIGSFSSIAPGVAIVEDFHRSTGPTTYFALSNLFGLDDAADVVSKGPVILAEDVWVGANACVLSGVTIGRGSVIGAGAVVVKDIPPYSIAVGNPARVVRKRFGPELITFLENSRWWTWDLSKIERNLDFFRSELSIDALPSIAE